MKRSFWIPILFVASSLHAAGSLRVVSAGPVGEARTMAEANEVRVVFSEPMVVVGRIPSPVSAPFFRIVPAVKGTFRWSDPTTLIFTPSALPFATKYEVSIDAAAKSVAGNTLDQAYHFSFTTPTIRLLSTNWYRKPDGAVVIGLTFNQPVQPATIVAHLKLHTATGKFEEPTIPDAGIERLKAVEPQALAAFEQKKAKAAAAAASNDDPVLSFLATKWDTTKLGVARPELVVVETKPGIPPGTQINVLLDDKLADAEKQSRGEPQAYVVQLEPMLFVRGLQCTSACDPDASNDLKFIANDSLLLDDVRKAVTITDITDPAHEVVLKAKEPDREYDYPSAAFSLDVLGYSLSPAHKYLLRVDPSLTANDGQTLGYTWMGTIENNRRVAFISFGDGQGVWESDGGSILPFHARNFLSVTQWVAPLTIDQTMPALLQLKKNNFSTAPKAASEVRKFNPKPDKIQSFGLDISKAVGANNHGLLWAAIKPGEAIPSSARYSDSTVATVVQVTNLGISVKDSPQNVVVLVATLDSAKPVAGANVSIRTTDNKVVWTGVTDEQGIVTADVKDLRTRGAKAKAKKGAPSDEWENSWEAMNGLHFIVVAEKDGDTAYAGSDWNEGIRPWDFETNFNINEANPLLRGTVFTDRGVYKLGEEIHMKAVVRSDTPFGIQLLPAGTKLAVVTSDSHAKVIDKRNVELTEWSSASWTVMLPADAPLGNYSVRASIAGQRLSIEREFLVAAYRRPDFRVDATLTAPTTLAGTQLGAKVTGRYLHGGPMAGRAVAWSYSKIQMLDVPSAITDRYPEERFTFLGWDYDHGEVRRETIDTKEASLDAKGELALKLPTDIKAGWPFEYRIEGDVTDVTRQHIAGRASYRVDPAPWYIGVTRPPYFADATKGIDTGVLAVALSGKPVAGVNVKIALTQIQWNSIRRSTGNGFYEWDTKRELVPAGEWTVTTNTEPAPLHVPLKGGGEYRLVATAADGEGRSTTTLVEFYATGSGYTAWARYDHNRIDLVPEKKTYRPGDTARIMVKSPWEHATAILTTERESVRTTKRFDLTSTQQTITVPITEADIPNVFVSVLLVKGRTKDAVTQDSSDPGKPAFRLGYVELNVEDASKRLKVDVKANRDEYRPGNQATIDLTTRDASGKASASEVTLWAVDYGVLSLTNYQTPDVLDSIYIRKALQVLTEDSRQRIVSRRVITPKGSGEGGGGGRDAGSSTIRKDFRVLAFWLGSVVTDANGHARSSVTLPESLTTYRIMAVAGDRSSRFGWGQNEIRVNKPLMLLPAFPRFMAVGDKAFFGGAVNSQKISGNAIVTIRSLDPNVIAFSTERATVAVKPNSATEARFDAVAKSVGIARIQMRVTLGRESDAFEDIIPVRVLASPETVAAYGEANPKSQQTLEIPANVMPGFGGLNLELASTQLVGLGEGAQYLVDYPYGCAEQRASSAFALMVAADLGNAFRLQGIDAAEAKKTAQSTLRDLERFQCGDGGFAYWAGECSMESPYLTSDVIHVYQRAQKLSYSVDRDVLKRAYDYLNKSLGEKRPVNESWWPAYTAWQAFAVKTLAEGGRNADSHVTRLYGYRDRMPIFALAYLADAMSAKGEKGERFDELHRRITNAVLPEGGQAHVGELNDPYLMWCWSSNVRSTAIVLDTLVRQGTDEELVKRMVRWLMIVRKGGRWGNTQENAWAMEALVDYYRKYESETPDFTVTVAIASRAIATESFKDRSTAAKSKELTMPEVQAIAPTATTVPVTFDKEGTGTLFYLMRLRYAPLGVLAALDSGISITRAYRVNGSENAATSFGAGDLIEVTLHIRNPKERRFVAVTDPLPAGTESVETSFATTASELVEQQERAMNHTWAWWERGGWDHVERHDDRVNVFATRLGEGDHEFKYLLRATTAGVFMIAPAHAEEMYEPEVFGRTATATVEVKR